MLNNMRSEALYETNIFLEKKLREHHLEGGHVKSNGTTDEAFDYIKNTEVPTIKC